VINVVRILDIGCGELKYDGSIGIDVRLTRSVDIIAYVGTKYYLPFRDNTFDKVYSSHVLEHFSHRETDDILKEWARVLKKNGTIEIIVPWLRIRALIFVLRPTRKEIINIYGGQDYIYNYHKCGFSFGIIKYKLLSVGFNEIKLIVDGYKLKGIYIPFLPSCLHVTARK
jgi:SAM-dependent methyltransferase